MTLLKDVAVGDQVVIVSEYGSKRRLAVVERVTATECVAGGIRFTKNGGEVGAAGFDGKRCMPAIDELVVAVKAEQRYDDAYHEVFARRKRIESLIRETHRLPRRDRLQWAASLEAVCPIFDAAIEKLRTIQPEVEAPLR